MNKVIFLFTIIFISGTSDAQINWDPIMDVAASSFGNNYPRIVTDASGNALITWGNADNMMFSKGNGSTFTTPVQINSAGISIAEQSWQGPDLACDGSTIYAVYKQLPEADPLSEIWCSKSTDGGISWSAGVIVDGSIGGDVSRFPTVTIDNTGNPIAAYMRFDSDLTNARWVVTKSTDTGASFGTDVFASGWSSGTSEVCDCCPGSITTQGAVVTMMYRDNDSNIRDSWVGISTDGATTFTSGMDVDQQAWNLTFCPSSGPDGIIIGDTLITTYVNGASGGNLVFFNKSSISDGTGSPAIPLTGAIASLNGQNYPRISNFGNNVGIVWQQAVSGNYELPILFTEDIDAGFTSSYEIIASENVTNADIAIADGQIHVVWQNNINGVVRYRRGTYGPSAGLSVKESSAEVNVYPNPTTTGWTISIPFTGSLKTS